MGDNTDLKVPRNDRYGSVFLRISRVCKMQGFWDGRLFYDEAIHCVTTVHTAEHAIVLNLPCPGQVWTLQKASMNRHNKTCLELSGCVFFFLPEGVFCGLAPLGDGRSRFGTGRSSLLSTSPPVSPTLMDSSGSWDRCNGVMGCQGAVACRAS